MKGNETADEQNNQEHFCFQTILDIEIYSLTIRMETNAKNIF